MSPYKRSVVLDNNKFVLFDGFRYRPITLFEIAIPPPMISVKDMTRDASFWINDLRAMATR